MKELKPLRSLEDQLRVLVNQTDNKVDYYEHPTCVLKEKDKPNYHIHH